MTPLERRASGSLALVFAARMLGLFLVLPVFALEAARYPGGDDPAWVGLAMGIYGLTQGVLQIPYGSASDRFGRKRVILIGLAVFAAGSFIAAAAQSLPWLIAGRSLQGAGAVSAAVTALLADLTRDEVRTKAMAMVGASKPVSVNSSGSPPTPEPAEHKSSGRPPGGLGLVLRQPGLLRLDVGVFVLHAVQLAMWVAVPSLLVQAGLDKDRHWTVYLPTVLASFVVMALTLFPLERRGYLRAVFLACVGLLTLVQLALALLAGHPSVALLAVVLFLFFCAFNVLEASQPSMASRLAPPQARGAALGVYNTLQSLGFFAGGAVGGWLTKHVGAQGLFAVCAGLTFLWLVVAWPMAAPGRSPSAEEVLADEAQAT